MQGYSLTKANIPRFTVLGILFSDFSLIAFFGIAARALTSLILLKSGAKEPYENVSKRLLR